MRSPTRYPQRSRTEWQQLRQAAVERFVAGERPLTIAPALGVSYEAVRVWYRRWRADDSAILEVKRRGRSARLTSEQLEQLQQELLRGPTGHGYRTGLRTLERIATVIRRLFAIRYHHAHVSKVRPDGPWFTTIGPLKAGGPFEVTVRDGETITINKVAVGEVWIGSNQSNMELSLGSCLARTP